MYHILSHLQLATYPLPSPPPHTPVAVAAMPKLSELQPVGTLPRGPPPISTPGAKISSSNAPPQGTGPAGSAPPTVGFSPVNPQYAGSGNISVTSQPAQLGAQMYRRSEGVPGAPASTFGVPNSVGAGQPFGAAAGETRERMFNPAASSAAVGPISAGGGGPPPTVVSSIIGASFNRGMFVQRSGVHGEGSPAVGEGGMGGDAGMPSASRGPVTMPMSAQTRVS